MLDLDAGKYAIFVWPAYGLTAPVLIGMIVSTLRHSRPCRRRAERTAH